MSNRIELGTFEAKGGSVVLMICFIPLRNFLQSTHFTSISLSPGASSGIGKGTALHLASLGCQLAIHGRNEENLRQVARECIAAGLSDAQVYCIILLFKNYLSLETEKYLSISNHKYRNAFVNLECRPTILKLKLVDILVMHNRNEFVNVAHQIA